MKIRKNLKLLPMASQSLIKLPLSDCLTAEFEQVFVNLRIQRQFYLLDIPEREICIMYRESSWLFSLLFESMTKMPPFIKIRESSEQAGAPLVDLLFLLIASIIPTEILKDAVITEMKGSYRIQYQKRMN